MGILSSIFVEAFWTKFYRLYFPFETWSKMLWYPIGDDQDHLKKIIKTRLEFDTLLSSHNFLVNLFKVHSWSWLCFSEDENSSMRGISRSILIVPNDAPNSKLKPYFREFLKHKHLYFSLQEVFFRWWKSWKHRRYMSKTTIYIYILYILILNIVTGPQRKWPKLVSNIYIYL
jgi:hypothetical protein